MTEQEAWLYVGFVSVGAPAGAVNLIDIGQYDKIRGEIQAKRAEEQAKHPDAKGFEVYVYLMPNGYQIHFVPSVDETTVQVIQ